MSIELDKETERLIRREIEAGRFQDAASLVGAAVRQYLVSRDLFPELSRQEVEAKISEAIRSLERGQGVDGETFVAQLLAETDEMDRRRQAG
jgi:antitoxin ParD1/3/4